MALKTAFAEIAARKRSARDDKLQKIVSVMDLSQPRPDPRRERQILSMSAAELIDAFRAGTVGVEEAMRASCARSAYVQMSTRAIAEENFEAAIMHAAEKDKELQQARKAGRVDAIFQAQPLFGVPVSVKDQVDMQGFDSTCGMAVRCFKPAQKNALLIQQLVNAGALPFVRSNIPQSLLLPESGNRIWGECTNPYDPTRSPGGSSGGEGVLVATGCSFVGVGTDIGGSLRYPALMCGCVTLKPTLGRVSSSGIAVPRTGSVTGADAIKSVPGALTRTAKDLDLVMSVWCNAPDESKELDPWGVKGSSGWRANVANDTRSLRVGFWKGSPWLPVCPAMERATRMARDAAKKAGHEVIDIDDADMPPLEECTITAAECIGACGMDDLVEGLEGEPLVPDYKKLRILSTIPNCLRPILARLLQASGEHRRAALCKRLGRKTAFGLFTAVQKREHLKKQLLHVCSEKYKVDAVIVPASCIPAHHLHTYGDLTVIIAYAVAWNLLAVPAGIIPVNSFVREDEQCYLAPDADGKPASPKDKFDKGLTAAMNNSAGLPLSAQIIALPYNDEVIVRLMKDIEKQLSNLPIVDPKCSA
eukprot:TRINITY_DN27912_c0_g1_i1.p1 TRINITY_DN27912_c0_g1~~TRINITY_DN27912_c0_g1_i1.p1  ORF type:complete len:601 (-),score=80.79 TRINITY_DN27912_c0_g1_i1:123-1892(-)